MKKFIFLAAAALCLAPAARAGEIVEGSVPGTINYQGRLERDNAPITGPVHLYFRLFNSATANNTAGALCGSPTQPCVWQSPELTVQAAQGIFSAELTPGIGIFTTGQKLYLEVQVESDTLSPREALNSITYALVAKKLEDGASVIVTTLTAGYQVLLATKAESSVGIGITGTPNGKLEVNGDIRLTAGSGGVIWFQDGTFISASGISSAGGLSAPADAIIIADSSDAGTGNVLFRTGANERARILNNGNMGIGTPIPSGKLDVDGSLYVGNEGIYDRDDSEVNIKEDLVVEGGRITGSNLESIYLGDTDNIIAFNSNGAERARIHSNDYLGVGIAAPASMIHSGADIAAESGVRGGRVSIGDYSTWTNLLNEVRAENGYHLLLQQTSPYNVGIGTNTPREKLHVRGSVRSDYGIMAATAAFSGDVRVSGEFRADGANREVFLTSTTIYGDSKIYGNLLITGGIGSVAGMPAYIASTQTFSGINTFQGQVIVSSNLAASGRLGAGVVDFDFAGSKYLQVGDNKTEFAYDNALAYLVAGSSAEAKINFYRGAVETARLETVSANNLPNLGLVLGGQVRTLTDSVYHRIQNSVLWVSTGYAGTPTIFASSSSAIVGIGTTVSDPNWRLTVAGNMRISGSGNGIFFPDGTSLTSGNLGALSVGNVSNNSDAVIQSDADQVSGGDVILRAGAVDGLVLKSGGNIGIGTVNPVSKLNVRGGDLVLGAPVNPYGADSVEDLVVGGNIVFDGEMLQRSAYPVRISGLVVAGDVYLSTGTGKMTGIGTQAPLQRLQVAGDVNIETGYGLRINNTAPSGQYLRGDGTRFASSLIVAAELPGTIVRTTETISTTLPLAGGGDLSANRTFSLGGLSTLGTANYVVGVNAAAGGWEYKNIVGVANETDVTHGVNTITIGLVDPLIVTKGGTGLAALAQGDLVYGAAVNAMASLAKDTNATRYLSNTGAANAPAWDQVELTNGVSGILPVANGGTGAATLTGVLKGNAAGAFSAMTGTAGTLAKWSDANTIAASVVRDDGADVGVGAVPTTGIKLDVNGKLRTTTFQMTNGGTLNYVLASDASGNASWVNPAGGGLGDGWVGNEITNAANATLTRSGLGTSGSPYQIALNLGNSNTWTAAQTFSGGLTGTLTGDITGDADTTDGLHAASGVNNVANQLVRTDASGYIQAGWINTISGDNGTTAITRIYASNDNYIRTYTLANFTDQIRTAASGGWGINITGNAATATALAANGANCTAGSFPLGVNASGAVETCADNITGNAATATALAANGANCTAGSFPLGVNASGAVETCADNITGNSATATKPATAGTAGRAVCWKVDGSLGSCSTVVDAGGACTCI